jgi:hypothetical protein
LNIGVVSWVLRFQRLSHRFCKSAFNAGDSDRASALYRDENGHRLNPRHQLLIRIQDGGGGSRDRGGNLDDPIAHNANVSQ